MLQRNFILIMFCLCPVVAHAFPGAGAINMTFNTSARAAGMGGAGVAVAWDTETNHWANPALLAFRPGIHYRSFESKLAEGLADDIFLTNEELTFGAYGVTLLLAKGPVKGNYLDMGMQEGTDENGESTGTFQSYMKSESIGLGVESVEILERILNKHPGSWTRYVSFAGGIAWHDFLDVLAPEGFYEDYGGQNGEGTATSMGYVLRLTPVDMSRGAGLMDNGLFGLSVGGSYGASILNKTDEFIHHFEGSQGDPFPRTYVSGWAANAQLTLADDTRLKLNELGFGFLGDMINPLVSFTKAEQLMEPGFTWNPDTSEYDYGHDTSGLRDKKNRGWELGLLNIFFIREGNILVEYGDIEGPTDGGGWKIQAGRFGGFRKDWATVPQAAGLPTVDRKTWSIWLNPLEIVNAFSTN
jgi:hypothetical protein